MIHEPYLDVGGMFLPLTATTSNFHISFGYQLNTYLGLGLSYNSASSYGGFDDKFNGFGIDYRIASKKWWFKNTIGFVNNYFPSQRSSLFEYMEGEDNDLFYRAAIGWIPQGGVFKIGFAYHLTDEANFQTFCPPGNPNCSLFEDKRRVGNLQLFIGVHLPNPNRKSLDKSILMK